MINNNKAVMSSGSANGPEKDGHRLCIFQVQPVFSARSEWSAFAAGENLKYEIFELSAPPALIESGRFQEYAKWCRQEQRVESLHGAFIDINPASSDEIFREFSRRRCILSCEQATLLGAKNVVFHSITAPFLPGSYLDTWSGICAEFYEELAEKYSLNLFIENSQDVNPKALETLMKRTQHPRIGVCLDFGHANYSRVSLRDWVDCLGDRIGYLHLSDNYGLSDDHLPAGEGIVDWEEADLFYRRNRKKMPVTLEFGDIPNIKKSLSYFRKHRFFGYGKDKQWR